MNDFEESQTREQAARDAFRLAAAHRISATARERAAYDLETLPLRQATLRVMLREDHHTVDAMRAIRAELKVNADRLIRARALLA